MKIYSNKTYIVWPYDCNAASRVNRTPEIVDGQQLRDKIRLGTMQAGDTIYETSFFATVKEKRAIELTDATGSPVEAEEKVGEKTGGDQPEVEA